MLKVSWTDKRTNIEISQTDDGNTAEIYGNRKETADEILPARVGKGGNKELGSDSAMVEGKRSKGEHGYKLTERLWKEMEADNNNDDDHQKQRGLGLNSKRTFNDDTWIDGLSLSAS